MLKWRKYIACEERLSEEHILQCQKVLKCVMKESNINIDRIRQKPSNVSTSLNHQGTRRWG